MQQSEELKGVSKLCLLVIFFIILCSILLTTTGNVRTSDISFAAVGDSETVYFKAEPQGAKPEVIWTLEYDQQKTSAIVYSSVSRYDVSRFVTMETTDNSCTLTCVKYATFAITYKFYLTLTATCKDNPELTSTCSICVGG